jgi:hypothetical protein
MCRAQEYVFIFLSVRFYSLEAHLLANIVFFVFKKKQND